MDAERIREMSLLVFLAQRRKAHEATLPIPGRTVSQKIAVDIPHLPVRTEKRAGDYSKSTVHPM
jgi:hypothetical protein